MDPGRHLCSECGEKAAEVFCTCTSPETFLCTDCVSIHMDKTSDVRHQLTQLTYYRSPGYYLTTRNKIFLRVKEHAKQSVNDLETAIIAYKENVEKAVNQLVNHSKKTIEQMVEKKLKLSDDIEEALEEVERTLREDKPTLTTLYGPLFRDMSELDCTVQLFSYAVETSTTPPESLVTLNFSIPSPEEMQLPRKFAGVYADKAFIFDVVSQQFTRATLSVNFSVGGSCVELDRNTLLCLGAQPASSAVYQLELPSFQLSPLPSLSIPRDSPGLAKIQSHAYVFGGKDGQTYLRTCEKMDLASKRWSELGRMTHPRAAFTPCYFRSLLYLISADNVSHRTVETFNPESEAFKVLPVSMPLQLELGYCSVAFISNEELCLLSAGMQMARWRIGVDREFRLSETGKVIWSNQQPLLVGSMALIAFKGDVIRFSLETYSLVQYLK